VFKKIINIVFKITNNFNSVWHQNIERKISEELSRSHYADITPEVLEKKSEKAREFYYARITNSSSLLIGLSSIFISVTALIVAVIAIIK